jgi:hypothetical protein
MVELLTIENLEKGEDKLTNFRKLKSIYGDQGELELDKFYDDNKDSNKIFIVQPNEEIDCDKYNYYHKESEYIYSTNKWKTYVKKISSIIPGRCKNAVKDTKDVIYRVERKNETMMQGLKSNVSKIGDNIKESSLFGNKSAGAPANTNATPADASTGPAAATPENTNAAPAAADATTTAPPAGDTVKKRFGWFGGNSDAKGGRKSRNQRKSRKQKNQRKSRKQRRSRR